MDLLRNYKNAEWVGHCNHPGTLNIIDFYVKPYVFGLSTILIAFDI